MLRRHFIHLINKILLLSFTLTLGCGTTGSMVRKFKSEEPYLKKKIMVFPAIDHSGLPSEKATEITANLVGLLKKSPRVLFYASPEDLSTTSEIKITEFGVAYYNSDIVKMAKSRNMNALMAVYMPPIEITKGRGGIWPFRYSTDIFKISMIVNVMDVTTGCLYLTNFDSEKIPLASEKVKDLAKKEAFNQALTKAMPDILERQSSAVIECLNKQSWTGRIVDVSKGILKINAGKEVGVHPGQLFTVHNQGESILCQTGITVDVPGKKVGRIKTTSVMGQYSLAVPDKGGPFSAGQTIVFKR